ncbi:MAG: hypothetical protein WC620_02520 [Methanoregula sp.]|jgi:hypothetical protein
MTSRRCTVLEQGAREQLRLNGYEVRILPTGHNQRQPLAHLVASKGADETRCIRIRKISHRSATIDQVEHYCRRDIMRYRSDMARHPMNSTIRHEIWLYTLSHGYHCFEILPDRIQEISPIAGKIAVRIAVGGAL